LSFLLLVFYDLPLPWPATSSSLTRRRQPTAREVRATVQVEPWQTDHDRGEVVSCPPGGEDLDVGSTFYLQSRWIRRGGDQCFRAESVWKPWTLRKNNHRKR
jgi:hypothetical protein